MTVPRFPIITLLCILYCGNSFTSADDFPTPVNTQAAGEHPPAPEEMPALFDLPDGFRVTLFAGEPDVQQPISFNFDDRGRILVAENYTYSGRGKNDPNLRDRIVILTDNDGDGRHDERRVFWDNGRMLTGLVWGHDGIWILNNGTLSFIPDRDGNDIPDTEPVVMLDGWSTDAGHNFVSGLMWGPDGWLYGRHGILDTSWPGTPGTPKDQRTPINCGIWRFHPTKHTFEAFCHGTTNPWGMDYNEHGQLFMTNNVRAHLWHVIPGAHYERMFGRDMNPHLYELMEACSDHYHWDTSDDWTESRDGVADAHGGGHSHCGGMFYLGSQFPKTYRGRLFMCNTHGRCVNVDRLEQHDSTYVGNHEPDFLKVNTPWFRGVDLREGPDGCVWLSDWSDNGECHDHDGVHRTSGRIFRISYGDSVKPATAAASEIRRAGGVSPRMESLVKTALNSDSEWRRRRAARLLTEADLPDDVVATLRSTATGANDEQRSLNAAWLLYATDKLDSATCKYLLKSPFEHLRALAVRAVTETPDLQTNQELLVGLAHTESSPFVQMAWASAVQRLPVASDAPTSLGRNILMSLLNNDVLLFQLEDDPQLRRMLWYAVEDVSRRGELVLPLHNPQLLKFAVRRITETDWAEARKTASQLLRLSGERDFGQREKFSVLSGMRDGLRGQRKVDPPDDWDALAAAIRDDNDAQLSELIDELSVLFGDGIALDKLRELVANTDADHTARSQAIAVLAQARDEASIPLLLRVLSDRAVNVDTARTLAAFDDARIPQMLLALWPALKVDFREAAAETLASRPTYARQLAAAIENSQLDAAELSAAHVRQLLSLDDPDIRRTIESHWGLLRDSPAEKAAAIAALKERLTDDVLSQADHQNGAAVFKKTCANCHRLYAEGGTIGPELTGANRTNMDYLLGNIIDPSAEVARQHTLSVIALTSGRVINGVTVGETAQSIIVQTEKEQVTIPLEDIDERVQTNQSLMPDGLLDTLSSESVRDLIAYLRRID